MTDTKWISFLAIAAVLLGGTISSQTAFADDELKVEIKIRDGFAEVKVESEDNKYEFDLATTNLDEILEITHIRTGIAIDLLKDAMNLEVRGNMDDSDDEIDDGTDDIKTDTLEKKLRASTIGDASEVKIELEFITDTTDPELLIDEILEAFAVTQQEAEDSLKIQEDDDDDLKEKFTVEIETDDEITQVEVELRYVLDSTDRDEIIASIVKQSQLDRDIVTDSIDSALESDGDSFDGILDASEGILDENPDGFIDDSELDTLRAENDELRDENQMLRKEIEDLKEQIANLNQVLMEQIRVILDTLASLRP